MRSFVPVQMRNRLAVQATHKAWKHGQVSVWMDIFIMRQQVRYVEEHFWTDNAGVLYVLVVHSRNMVNVRTQKVLWTAKLSIANFALNRSLFDDHWLLMMPQQFIERLELFFAVLRALVGKVVPCLEVFKLFEPRFRNFTVRQKLWFCDYDFFVEFGIFWRFMAEDFLDFFQVSCDCLKALKDKFSYAFDWIFRFSYFVIRKQSLNGFLKNDTFSAFA